MSNFKARQFRDIIDLLETNKGSLQAAQRPIKLKEDAGQPMTILVHNSGWGTEKKPRQVFNTNLKMSNNGQPMLYFAFSQGEPAEYYASFTSEGWVADMD